VRLFELVRLREAPALPYRPCRGVSPLAAPRQQAMEGITPGQRWSAWTSGAGTISRRGCATGLPWRRR
jgi:hypothetical protein